MTLTSILPTLRRSIPDPLAADLWPAHTRATTSDVVVAGVSMVRLVELCGAPCVHTASAAAAGTDGLLTADGDRAVAVLEVASVRRDGDSATVDLDLDGDIGDIGADWSQLRLLGRASTAAARRYLVARTGVRGAGAESAVLPGDLGAGDLVAVPCAAPLAVRRLRRA